MATVVGVTQARADSIEDRLIINASRQGSSLVFSLEGGSVITVPGAFPALYEFYPVGSIYMSDSSANPATYMGGGTWVRWGRGRVPLSVDETDPNTDAPDKVGGSKTHTLAISEMPSHGHPQADGNNRTGLESHSHTHSGSTNIDGSHSHTYESPNSARTFGTGTVYGWDSTRHMFTLDPSGAHNHYFTTGNPSSPHYHAIAPQGGGMPHNIMQPYITIYMWKRTA